VQHVKLPPPLAENPYLQEFYGGIEELRPLAE
jgi:hypothetical protein